MFDAFILGLLTPLTAVCVLPLYPGFVSYLASKKNTLSPLKVSLLIMAGIISFMALLGIIFTTVLQVSLSRVTQIVSPIAFAILGLVGLFLLIGKKIGAKNIQLPQSKSPTRQAFLYGLFFGAIVLPCNPGFIAAFFASALLISSPVMSMVSFLLFGLGLATPLVVLATAATTKQAKTTLRWLTTHATLINRIAGAIMLTISLYYLLFVFL